MDKQMFTKYQYLIFNQSLAVCIFIIFLCSSTFMLCFDVPKLISASSQFDPDNLFSEPIKYRKRAAYARYL